MADEPVLATSPAPGVYTADGGAGIDLPAEVLGGVVLVTIVEGDQVDLLAREAGAGPDDWPRYLGLVSAGSRRFAAVAIPVAAERLWVSASGPWSLSIRPVELPEADSVVSGTGPARLVHTGGAGSAVLRSAPGFDVDVVGPEGLELYEIPEGSSRLEFSWPPGELVVIRIDVPDGVSWTLEVGGGG